MAKSKKKGSVPVLPSLSKEGRAVDYEAIRTVASSSNIIDVTAAHFAAKSSRPLAGIDGRSLHHEAKLRGEPVGSTSDQVLLTVVEFKYKASENGSQTEVCTVHGTFVVAYLLQDSARDVPAESLEMFAEVNGMYHAWPYIREIVGSCTARFGLGGVVLPVWIPPKTLPPKGQFIEFSMAAQVDGQAS